MSGGSRIIPIDSGAAPGGRTEEVLELVEPVDDMPQGAPAHAPGEPPAFGAAIEAAPPAARLPEPEPWSPEESWAEPEAEPRGRWREVLPVAIPALLAIAGWTAFSAHAAGLSTGSGAAQWSAWIAQWSLPVALIVIAWAVLSRSQQVSRREATQFATIARTLGEESQLLEARLARMNGELSIAREFIAAQGQDLEALGRLTSERLEGSAAKLQSLVGDTGKRVDQIGSVSAAALDNMEKLRGQLPVVANSAKDVTNHIANAGRTAHVQIEDMIAGFQRLNEFGTASERQVLRLRELVGGAIAELLQHAEGLRVAGEEHLGALAEAGATHRNALSEAGDVVLASVRSGFAALSAEIADQQADLAAAGDATAAGILARLTEVSERIEAHEAAIARSNQVAVEAWTGQLAELSARREAVDAAIAEAASAMAAAGEARASQISELADRHRSAAEAHLAALDSSIAERRAAIETAQRASAERLVAESDALESGLAKQTERQRAHAASLGAEIEALTRRVADLGEALQASTAHSSGSAEHVEKAIAALDERLGQSRALFTSTDKDVAKLTEGAVRLLELIRGVSEHSSTLIPEAVRTAEGSLAGIETRVDTLAQRLGEAGDTGRALAERIDGTRDAASTVGAEFANLHAALSTQFDRQSTAMAELRASLHSARLETEALAREAQEALAPAITRLSEAAEASGKSIRDHADKAVGEVADSLGESINTALMRVLQGRAAELLARLEEAIDRAADTSRESALALRDQLARVDELAGNLESRVARARSQAEEQVDNDFARRAALITESLNSTAIDLAKALSADVSETAWASYLRGDRGIFTRRAVSLLESGEARAVQAHYEADGEFREHVNRYVHDFEAMLRSLLSTRDGNALGVTLLSSDMGKLYVALAQGIERLRA